MVKDKIVNIIRDSLKNSIFRVGVGGGEGGERSQKETIYRRELLNKRMRLGEFVDLRGGWCF